MQEAECNSSVKELASLGLFEARASRKAADRTRTLTAEERQQAKEARRKKKEYLRKRQQKLVALRLSSPHVSK